MVAKINPPIFLYKFIVLKKANKKTLKAWFFLFYSTKHLVVFFTVLRIDEGSQSTAT